MAMNMKEPLQLYLELLKDSEEPSIHVMWLRPTTVTNKPRPNAEHLLLCQKDKKMFHSHLKMHLCYNVKGRKKLPTASQITLRIVVGSSISCMIS